MEPIRVLLISSDAETGELVGAVLSNQPGEFRLQWVRQPGMARARLAGGGVDVVLADYSSSESVTVCEAAFLKAPPAGTVLALSEAHRSLTGKELIQRHARAALPRDRWGEIPALIRSILASRLSASLYPAVSRPRERQTRIAFIGAKGGVGTSTVALNVAATLAQDRDVVLAELRPTFGTLAAHLRPEQSVRTVESLLMHRPEDISTGLVQSALWPIPRLASLRILFAASDLETSRQMDHAHVEAIANRLSDICQNVFLDLPADFYPTTQAALRRSDLMVLVLDRDLISLETAKRMLLTIHRREWAPAAITAVIVNRVAFASPVSIPEIEAQLGLSIAGVLPPSSDLCLAAQRAHCAVEKLEPESLLAHAFAELTRKLHE